MPVTDYRTIWLLLGHRRGDNAQVLALGRKLAKRLRGQGVEARLEEKQLAWNALRVVPNLLLPPTLKILPAHARRQFEPPWPDVVIGVGRRAVPVARWIQRRNENARIIWLGRPRAPLCWFDMVLSTPQYGLPRESNVVMLDLPPVLPAETDERELARWREKFSGLPRPLMGVLVGGAHWPLRFDARDAKKLGQDVFSLISEIGGGWVVSTSPRTGSRQARVLHEVLGAPSRFYYWRENGQHNNPHRALLRLADCFVVTSDSASMIAEAVLSGKQVFLFDLQRQRPWLTWRTDHGIMRWLAVRGVLSPPRDMRALCQGLVARGLAQWLHPRAMDADACGEKNAPRGERELEEALARIESWLVAK